MIPRACRAGRRHTTWSVVAQLQLFPANSVSAPQHREPCKKKGEMTGRGGDIDLPTVQRVVPAAGAPLPTAARLNSVFAMATAAPIRMKGQDRAACIPRAASRIVREDGVTRHIAVRLQDTAEWAEKEEARRARQRPPRPPRQKFKMKGSRAWSAEQQ